MPPRDGDHLDDGARHPLADRDFRRILIVKPSSLGDVVHALPVLHSLRRRYPRASIHWLVATPFAPLIENHPDLDGLVRFDRDRFSRVGRSLQPTLEFVDFLRALHAEEFDLTIDLQGLFRSGFLSFATGAPIRVGPTDSREGAGIFYTHRIPEPPASAHAADRNQRVGRLLGYNDSPMCFDLAVTDSERADAARILTEAGLDSEAPFIALWPGARWETKRWPAEKFTALVDRLVDLGDLPAVLMGDPTEKRLCQSISRGSTTRPVILAGRTSIRQAIAILERSALVVTHDSAPMHLAAALDRPLIALLGPTNPHRTGPHNRLNDVLQADLPCVPCYLRRLAQCPYDHQCMRDLTVDQVATRAAQALNRPLPAPLRSPNPVH